MAASLIATDRELVSVEPPIVNVARENGVMLALPSSRFNGPTQPYEDQRRATRDAGGNELKAIGLTQFGGPEVLRVAELPEPRPGRGDIRIKVHAAAVSATDITFRSGRGAAQLAERPPPYVPGVDVAGIIDLLGPGTDDRLAVGDAVIAFVALASLEQQPWPLEQHQGIFRNLALMSVCPFSMTATFYRCWKLRVEESGRPGDDGCELP
jgi:hypothetical protein